MFEYQVVQLARKASHCLALVLGLTLLVSTRSAAETAEDSVSGIITIGDSLTAGLSITAGGTVRCAAQGNRLLTITTLKECKGNGVANVGGWQPTLSQIYSTTVFNNGNTGELTPAILARTNSILASQSGSHVLIWGGTNDAIRGNINTAISSIRSMLDQVYQSGKIPIVATIPPLSGSSVSSRNSQVLTLNGWILDLPQEYEGLVVADMYARLAPVWSQATSGDFIHLGSFGNSLVAEEWDLAIQRDYENRNPPIPIGAVISAISVILLDEEEEEEEMEAP